MSAKLDAHRIVAICIPKKLLQYLHWVVLQDKVLTIKAIDCSDHFMYTSTIIKVMQIKSIWHQNLQLDGNYKKDADAFSIQLQVKAKEFNSFCMCVSVFSNSEVGLKLLHIISLCMSSGLLVKKHPLHHKSGKSSYNLRKNVYIWHSSKQKR